MNLSQIDYTKHYSAVMNTMTKRGLLLCSYDAKGKPNAMTIGWGAIGSIWGVPAWIVLVRPSRYTFECIEHTGCFTVNAPPEDLSSACAICGSRTGRDEDKLAAAELTSRKAQHVLAPLIDGCPVVYECQVVHSNDILPTKLSDEILTGAYVDGDYHRIYFGKILNAMASDEASELLK